MSGLESMIQRCGSGCRTACLNVNTVRAKCSHKNCRYCNKANTPPGDKIRQQRELENQEIIIPPSFGSSYAVDTGPSTTAFANSLRSFNNQDDRSSMARAIQSHDTYNAFDSINPQDILAPEHDIPGTMGHHVQSAPTNFNRSTASPVGRPRFNGTSQANAVSLGPLAPPPSSINADSRDEYWMSMSSSDPQWAMPGYQNPPAPLPNMAGGVDNPRPTSSHPSRQVPRPSPRRAISSSSHPHINIPSTPRMSETHQSPILQKQLANQTYQKPGYQTTHSPLEPERRGSHSTCSHCGSSRAADMLDDQRSGYASPKTCRSTSSRSSNRTSSTDEMDILSNCGKILAGLAREGSTDRESSQRHRHHRRKRSRDSSDEGSPRSDRNSQDESHREGSRRDVVEKVVILCLKNGRVKKY